MSTSNGSPVKEQVLYFSKSKQWEPKDVSVSELNGKCQLSVRPKEKRILKQRKMEIELSENNYCVVEMGIVGSQSNVIGLLCMKRGSKIQGHFFKSEDRQKLNNLKAILRRCCKVDSFEVNVAQNCSPSQSTKAQLHVFHDKICLSSNSGYDFKILCEYPLNSLSNWQQDQENVTLTVAHKGKEERLSLRTDKGSAICAKLSSFVQEGSQGKQQCDGNSNIIPSSKISKSCEIFDRLTSFTRPKAMSFSTRKPEPKSPLASEQSMDTEDFKQDCFESCFVSTGNFESFCDGVTLTAVEICDDADDQSRCSSPHDLNDDMTRQPPPPPPIPQRLAKQNSGKDAEVLITRRQTLPPSFRIVSKPPLAVRERQCNKNEPSLKGMRTVEIKELVQPICLDPSYRHSGNCSGSYIHRPNEETNNIYDSSGLYSPKGEEEDVFSMAGIKGGSEPFVEQPKIMQNRASPQPSTMATSFLDTHADGKTQGEGEEQSSDSTCHYVNLPEGSRPSCYLYMNFPNLKTAPKEAPVYINHVFMSRSMQGIYENVQQFCNEKFEKGGAPETGMSAPPLPPPALKPRQPPPRLPKRAIGGGQRVQPAPPRSPPYTGAPPPPRPPKKNGAASKMLERCTQQQDIQVTIAVFASKAVAGREWFLRIVVMQHDPDDSTFKMVMDRERASNYRLMQTHPFSISSDIVISLKHQCKQFKLTSENSQEVGYNIIKDLLHGFWFVIEFHLEHLGSDGEHFAGNVCVEPKDLPPGEKCPVNKRVNLGINEDFELKQRFNYKQHGNRYGQENQTSKHVISDYAKRKKMCKSLDIFSSQNWRDVAGQLGFSFEEIKGIEDRALRCVTFSPMEEVLTTWEQRDPESSLERLINVLREVQRLDVISDLGFPVDSETL